MVTVFHRATLDRVIQMELPVADAIADLGFAL
jgi:hypothetical protein